MNNLKQAILFLCGFVLGGTSVAILIGIILSTETDPADWNQITKIEAIENEKTSNLGNSTRF